MSCTDKNPLLREGTSQLNRVLDALDVHFADVDERDESDLILFAKQYAAYLQYYDQENQKDGDWQSLMMMDISVTLSTLARINVKQINDYKRLLYKNISATKNETQINKDSIAKQQLKYLFDALFSSIRIIDEQLNLLPGNDYTIMIKEVINSKLKSPLTNLADKFFVQFKMEALLNYNVLETDSYAPLEIISDENFKRTNLSALWQGGLPDLNITLPTAGGPYEKIVHIIHHNLFNGTIDSLLNGIALVTSRANESFNRTLSDFPQHAPHYGLYLTFVKLFKTAQQELNSYSQKHLDFYYKDILRLKNKNPIPDKVHLTFELQKNIPAHLLRKGILFKGGKDIKGKEISYTLKEDVVLNKAIVSKIQAQHIDITNNSLLRSFSQANSEDGEGAKLISPDKSWFTFGNPASMKTARTGFAFASNILFLKEGTRTITVIVSFVNKIPGLVTSGELLLSGFFAELTGQKVWISKSVLATYTAQDKQIIFVVSLTPNDQAVIPYSEKIHKQNLEISLPLLKIYLNQDAIGAIPYSILSKQQITEVRVEVEVVGVKDLMLSSDNGSIDASKPFKPFGDFPDAGASFYIGSKEIFQKKISELVFNYLGDNPFNNTAEFLGEAKWNPLTTKSDNVISAIDIEPATMDFTANESLKTTSLNGFIRLHNKTSKSLSVYFDKLKGAIDGTRLNLVAGGGPLEYQLTVGTTPVPEEIKLSEFSIGYKAFATVEFTEPTTDRNNNLFYHITSFGFEEIGNDDNPLPINAEDIIKYTLLADLRNNGELFLGFENLLPRTVISILFQMAEGSSNPLKNMESVKWYYLTGNKWCKFEKRNVIDRTSNFTQPGVVTITIPQDISDQNTLFQKGFHWIKAAVENNIDAVCRMILVQSQAASVELVQDDSKQVEFRKTISANTISKLVESDAAIKTITQPFEGFSGRVRESDVHFYTRVSERLRHKQRAISIWDYEHILLEEFPQLYKVKCLNHSGFYQDSNGKNIFCENFPGHVTIIPLPDLKSNLHANRLKPNTPIGLLNNMYDYLTTIISPFVKLNVSNPRFEEVRLEFKVTFHDNIDETFYSQLLNNEIEKFLCPWAFDGKVEIAFGSKIIKSALLNFVEEREYVDYVSCFEMHHLLRENGEVIFEKRNIEEAVATSSRSILVSYYDELSQSKHIINSPANCNCNS